MGSNETATATTGGPRVIGVFYGNGAPSGPNHLLFSDVDRPSNLLWDSSVVGRPRRPHAPALGALLRALDPKLWYWSVCCWGPVLICIHRWKRPRMRCRRLRTSSIDPRRLPGGPRATNRQDSTGAADHFWRPVGARELNFFFRHPVSVVSIAPDDKRPKRYSNNSRAHLTLFTPGS